MLERSTWKIKKCSLESINIYRTDFHIKNALYSKLPIILTPYTGKIVSKKKCIVKIYKFLASLSISKMKIKSSGSPFLCCNKNSWKYIWEESTILYTCSFNILYCLKCKPRRRRKPVLLFIADLFLYTNLVNKNCN